MPSDERKPRAVVDTNLFVSGLLNVQGLPYQLLEALRHDAFTLLISEEQRAELEDVLHRPRLLTRYRLSPTQRDLLLTRIDAVGQRTSLSLPLPVSVRDPKDEMIVATAIGGSADYVVTGDVDLLILGGDPLLGALRIVTVRHFLEVLTQADDTSR